MDNTLSQIRPNSFLPPPLAPSLPPQFSAVLRCLAGTPGSLWGAPSLRGGILHWQGAASYAMGAEANAPILGPEAIAQGSTVGEDWDAEPCVEVRFLF